MNSIVHRLGRATPSTTEVAARIAGQSDKLTSDGISWTFHLMDGSKLSFYRMGDYLLQDWFESPMMMPLLWWYLLMGWSLPKCLTIQEVEQAIGEAHFKTQMQDCCQQGLAQPPTTRCEKELKRLEGLTHALSILKF